LGCGREEIHFDLLRKRRGETLFLFWFLAFDSRRTKNESGRNARAVATLSIAFFNEGVFGLHTQIDSFSSLSQAKGGERRFVLLLFLGFYSRRTKTESGRNARAVATLSIA